MLDTFMRDKDYKAKKPLNHGKADLLLASRGSPESDELLVAPCAGSKIAAFCVKTRLCQQRRCYGSDMWQINSASISKTFSKKRAKKQ